MGIIVINFDISINNAWNILKNIWKIRIKMKKIVKNMIKVRIQIIKDSFILIINEQKLCKKKMYLIDIHL